MEYIKRVLDFIKVSTFLKKKKDSYKFKLWDSLNKDICPYCNSSLLQITARGGDALNIKCSKCETIYWTSSCRDFGTVVLTKSPFPKKIFFN